MAIRAAGEGKKGTFQSVAEHYLANYADPRGNGQSDRYNLVPLLRCFGDWKGSAIKESDVEVYAMRRGMGAYSSKGIKAASSTIRREIVMLQAVLNYGSRKELIPGNQRFHFSKPPEGRPRDKWLTEDQEKEIITKMVDAPLTVQIFLQLALTYGVRRGAILDLRFGDQVNFVSNVIDFNVPGARTTRKRRTVVPMTRSVRASLGKMQETKRRGDRACDFNTVQLYEKFMASIGFEWVTPHVLKHSAITLMLRSGVKEMDVAKLTATDLRTIAKVYRHHSQKELLDIAELRGI